MLRRQTCPFVLTALVLRAMCLWSSLGTATTTATRSEGFKHDVDVAREEEGRGGQRLRLHSRGVVDVVDFDSFPQIKRVVCTGNRLLLAMTDSAVAHGWRAGQVVRGSPRWNCNATEAGRNKSSGVQIYAKISRIAFTAVSREDGSGDDTVTIDFVPAGPLDMLREASIFFRYEPGEPLPAHSRERTEDDHQQKRHNDARSRFRRSVSNTMSGILGTVDWQANFSSVIPLLGTEDSVAVHKTWGQAGLNVTTGTNAKSITDHFVLLLENLSGQTAVAYTFDLVIKTVDGSPQIVRYVSKFDIESDIAADASLKFTREMGVSYNTTVREFPKQDLLRIPVVKPIGLPPVYLTVTAQSLISATVHAYSSGASVLKTGYSGSGGVTFSRSYGPNMSRESDVTSRDWSLQPRTQSLTSRVRTQAEFSLHQKLIFTSAVSWHYEEMDLELSPPAEFTLRPTVSLLSSRRGLARCVNSTLTVDTLVKTSASQLTVTGYGLPLWEVPVQAAMSKELLLLSRTLGTYCEARCDGPSEVIADLSDPAIRPFTRADEQFKSLRKLDGNQMQFKDGGSDATWCGAPGVPCFSCSVRAYDTSPYQTCAARLMTSHMATAVSQFAASVEAEWPQKQLLVMEAWDEGTFRNPNGTQAATSLYKHGRAATLGVTLKTNHTTLTETPTSSPTPQLLTLDLQALNRLGQLAVCSGFELVRLDDLDSTVKVGVSDTEVEPNPAIEEEEEDFQEMFWSGLENLDVTSLHPMCVTAPRLDRGTTWPDVTEKPEQFCGPVEKALLRTDRKDMSNLVQFRTDGASLTFEPEGPKDAWCGVPSRQCVPDCSAPTSSAWPWDWCSTRMMTPRLARRLQTLQRLVEKEGIALVVKEGFEEKTEALRAPSSLSSEGRALKLSTVPEGQETALASLAVCAGFDFVEHRQDGHVMVYVITQYGYRAQTVEYLEGSSHVVIPPTALEGSDVTLPTQQLQGETDFPLLVDGGFRPDVYLSEHVATRDVISRDSRYFRMDELLLTCVEMAMSDFPLQLEIIKGSAYRTRSDDFLHNLDARVTEEQWRHQTGQALELRPLPTANSSTLLLLAKSILRACPSLAKPKLKAVGLGCHNDSVYVDFRPVQQSGALGYVKVWDTDTAYCSDVIDLQVAMLTGGPVIYSDVTVTCKDRGLDPGMEFLAFQMNQTDLCDVPNQDEFCAVSLSARQEAADRLQEVLTNSAGHGRLPRHEIIDDIRACLVDNCGGCPGSGPIFDDKVRRCSRVVHKYLDRAAAPYPDLTNVMTFFNTDTDISVVAGAACRDGNVCVEETSIYSLLLSATKARFYPDLRSTVERGLFDAAVNPTPLLDIAAQELAARAAGRVTVFLGSETDVSALKNVLKVLFTYNIKVSLVEFQVVYGVDSQLVVTSLQRKVTDWAGVTCPEHSRFAVTPFLVVEMELVRNKRSAEMSEARNKVKSNIYDWEKEWLKKML